MRGPLDQEMGSESHLNSPPRPTHTLTLIVYADHAY